MAGTERISLDVFGAVARIELRNGPLNVIDVPMMDDLVQAWTQIEADPTVSVIVIRGAGKAFSAGVDVAAHAPDKVEEMLAKFHTVIRSLDRQQESQHSRCSRPLLWWWRGVGDGLRSRSYCGRCAVGISGNQAGMLSAGRVRGSGDAGRTEAGRRTNPDGTIHTWQRSSRDWSGNSSSRCQRIGFCGRRLHRETSFPEPILSCCCEESHLRLGCRALRKGSGARRENVHRRTDEDCRRPGGHPRIYGKTPTQMEKRAGVGNERLA